MNIVVKCALAGAALTCAYACANPVEITGDVLRVDPSSFGDGGVLLGGAAGSTDQGGAGGTGGTSSGTGGSGGGTGTALGGTGGAGMPVGLSGAGGVPIGAGGSVGGGTGGTAQGGAGGAGGAAAGTGGAAAGTGGAAAGTGGTGGTGTTAAFDPESCDFEDLAGCEDLTCEAACSTTDGGSCRTRCEALITCVTTDPACSITEADPLCAARVNGNPAACTQEADSAGGANTTQATQPAFVARELVECVCSVPRL
jgi:hypothetical protein